VPIILSILPDSTQNSFVTLEEYKTFLSSRLPYPVYTDSDGNLITGSDFLTLMTGGTIDDYLSATLINSAKDLTYGLLWNGEVTYIVDNQQLAFPRTGLTYINGDSVSGTTNPAQIKLSQMELAAYLIESPEILQDDEARKGNVKKVKASSVEVEFQNLSLQGVDLLEYNSLIINPNNFYLRFPSSVLRYIPLTWYRREEFKPKKKPFMVGL
jgi:hypothetical protein